jgi:hypothetical protein
MRLGFFGGIDGDHGVFSGILALLADCDRIVSLGNLIGEPGPADARVLASAAELVAAGRLVLLAGPGERARGHDASLPPELRALLRGTSPATVVEGVAVLGGGRPLAARPLPSGRRGVREPGEGPRLVAPVTVAAGEATRTWRAAAGSLARIEPLAGPLALARGGDRVRIDVGPALGDDGVQGCLAIDLATRTAEVRERLWFRARLPVTARAPERAISA